MRTAAFVGVLWALVATGTLGCDNPKPSEPEGAGSAVINALSSADISRVVVTVSGDGISPDIVVELSENPPDSWQGLIEDIPVGTQRIFTAEAYDDTDALIYSGQATGITIVGGVTISVTIPLQEVDPPPPFGNAVPIITSFVVSPLSVYLEEDVELFVTANDANPDDILTYEWSGTGGDFSNSTSPYTVWTAPDSPGIYTVSIAVSDPTGATAELSADIVVSVSTGSAEVFIVVNTSPEVWGLIPSPTRIDAGESTQLDLTAVDPEEDSMIFQWSTDCDGFFNDVNAEDPILSLNTVTGTTCTLTVQINDGNGGSNQASITIQTGPPMMPGDIPLGCTGPIEFPDTYLESSVRDAIGIPEGAIYFSDIAGLTSLRTGGNDLTGIECLQSLVHLHQYGADDFSLLAGLPNLTELVLYSINDHALTTLVNVTGLTYLVLQDNLVHDISPLAYLTNLKYLDLSYNGIWDVSPLQNLTNLTHLNLYANSIDDLSPLANLTNLVYLDLTYFEEVGNARATDMGPLANLTNLNYLSLRDNDISDLSPLAGLTNLTELDMSYNSIDDISPLTNLTALMDLNLDSNNIVEISPLTNLVNLTDLWIRSNNIVDIYPLAANTGIDNGDVVRLQGNPLDLEDVATVSYLAELEARGVSLDVSAP